MIFALLLGIPTLRLRADYLAIVTIAAAEIIRYVVTTNELTDITGSANGLAAFEGGFYAMNPFPRGTYNFGLMSMNERDLWIRVVAWTLVALCCLLVLAADAQPLGPGPEGHPRRRERSAFFRQERLLLQDAVPDYRRPAGHPCRHRSSRSPAARSSRPTTAPELTFFLWTCLLLGGMATVLGPVVGAMIFWVVLSLTQGLLYGAIEAGYITFLTTTQAGQLRYILVGVALMLLMIFRPQGVLGNKKELAFA